MEFPNVKNHKGVSNFLVRLSSSSAHCWVNIRERGEEKKIGRKESGERKSMRMKKIRLRGVWITERREEREEGGGERQEMEYRE